MKSILKIVKNNKTLENFNIKGKDHIGITVENFEQTKMIASSNPPKGSKGVETYNSHNKPSLLICNQIVTCSGEPLSSKNFSVIKDTGLSDQMVLSNSIMSCELKRGMSNDFGLLKLEKNKSTVLEGSGNFNENILNFDKKEKILGEEEKKERENIFHSFSKVSEDEKTNYLNLLTQLSSLEIERNFLKKTQTKESFVLEKKIHEKCEEVKKSCDGIKKITDNDSFAVHFKKNENNSDDDY